jgi:Pyruvate/2-oxoacid:ferredoxin oxidoreductase delta subunit
MRRHEVKAFLPDTAKCIHGILQHAAKGSVQDSIRILFAVGNVVKRHPALRAEVAKSPGKEIVVGMLQAAAKRKRTYTNSYSLSQICVAQYNLQISCEQFWQQMPETCIEACDDRAACSVVYAYGKLHEARAVPSPSDRFSLLQQKLVVHHAAEMDAQGVSNVAWSLSKQGLLLGDAALALQSASLHTAASMNAQDVAVTLWALARMN